MILIRPLVQRDRPADGARIGAKHSAPQAVAEDGHTRSRALFFRRIRSAQPRGHAQKMEEAARDIDGIDVLSESSASQREVIEEVRGGLAEDFMVLTEVDEIRTRRAGARQRRVWKFVLDEDQPIRLAIRERLEHGVIQHGEYRGRRNDPDAEHQHTDSRHRQMSLDLPHAAGDVRDHSLHGSAVPPHRAAMVRIVVSSS